MTTEISVETTETVVIRRSHQAASGWCSQCGMQTEMLSIEEAAVTLGISPHAISGRIQEGRIHAHELQQGHLRVCLRSLSRVLEQRAEAQGQ